MHELKKCSAPNNKWYNNKMEQRIELPEEHQTDFIASMISDFHSAANITLAIHMKEPAPNTQKLKNPKTECSKFPTLQPSNDLKFKVLAFTEQKRIIKSNSSGKWK